MIILHAMKILLELKMKSQREREIEIDKSGRGKREEASYIKRGGGVKWSHQRKRKL
jgi:hypothetical protein